MLLLNQFPFHQKIASTGAAYSEQKAGQEKRCRMIAGPGGRGGGRSKGENCMQAFVTAKHRTGR